MYTKLTSKGRVISRRLRQIFCQRVVLEWVFYFFAAEVLGRQVNLRPFLFQKFEEGVYDYVACGSGGV